MERCQKEFSKPVRKVFRDNLCCERLNCSRIKASSSPAAPLRCTWRMRIVGTVYRNGCAGSIIEVVRIEGKIFMTMKEAEAHGLELAKEWVDKR